MSTLIPNPIEDLLRDLSSLRTDLTLAYAELIAHTHQVQKAQSIVQTDRGILNQVRAKIILKHADDPKALGANEAAREAKLAELTAGKVSILQDAEALLRDSQNDERLAALKVESLRAQLRCIEASVALLTGRQEE